MSVTKHLALSADHVAPDGSEVRLLAGGALGGMAHFSLKNGSTSIAVAHRTVEEIWFFLSGNGEMWRRQNGIEEVVSVDAGVSLTIPVGTQFQFRAFGSEPLKAIAITMPPWPGPSEAYAVMGSWIPTVSSEQ
jgi:mannose-6-phosphate isomerase-like protein (cupin superfamily)